MKHLYPQNLYRGTVTTFVFLIVVFLMPHLATAQNLITNSGFSNGTAGWTSSCSVEVYAENVYGGTSSTNMVTEIDNERCLDQTICVFPGTTYVLSFKGSRRISSQTSATVGISISVKGVTSNTTYVSQNKSYNNTTFNYTTSSYGFSIPANSTDRKVTLHISDYHNNDTYGVIMDDIELHPQTDMALSGITAATLNSTYSYAISNAPASGISYNWNLGANSTPGTSTAASPSVKWTATGGKNLSVDISNGTCVVATLSTTVSVTGVLPVHFTSYSGSLKDNKALVTWATADEQHNAYFVVERSVNGNRYDSAGRVQAATTTGVHNYAFAEANYNTVSYYRIRQVDENGSYTYSAVIILKNNSNSSEMTVYPSAATTSIQYAIGSEVQAQALVQVFDLGGRAMIGRNEVLFQGANNKTLDVSKLATGAYMLKVSIPATGVSAVKQFRKL
jgi:hypothetical protein